MTDRPRTGETSPLPCTDPTVTSSAEQAGAAPSATDRVTDLRNCTVGRSLLIVVPPYQTVSPESVTTWTWDVAVSGDGTSTTDSTEPCDAKASSEPARGSGALAGSPFHV